MNKTFYRTGRYKVNHNQFGGFIYPSDFNTDHRGKEHRNGSAIAIRIANDSKFDEQCRKNIINRQNYGGPENA